MPMPWEMDWSGGSDQSPQTGFVKTLTGMGWSQPQAAGIVGNLGAESRFSPTAVGDQGSAFGLAQWRGPRLKALYQFAKSNSLDPRSSDTQLQFLNQELGTTEARAGTALRAATTPEQAATAFMGYERPSGYSPAHPQTGAGYSRRLQLAQEAGGQASAKPWEMNWGDQTATQPSAPSPPLSGWTPGQVAELQTRQAPQQKPGTIAGAFQATTQDPMGALSESTSKIAQKFGMSEAWANRLGRDIATLPEAMGPLGAEASPSAFMPQGVAPVAAAPEVAPAAGRIGVEMPGAAMGGPITQNVAKKLSDIPLVGTPIEEASKKAIGQLGQAATTAEQGYGAGSVPLAGEKMREGITGYIKGTSAEAVSAQYDKVDTLLDPNVAAPLPATQKITQAISAERGAAALGDSKAVQFVSEALGREGMTYAGVKKLRTAIGEMLDTGVLPADMSGTELKRIYGSLTEDLRGVIVKAGGQKALAQWERANRYSALVSANREKLNTVLGAKNDEGVINRILAAGSSSSRADIKLLSRARKAVDPATWNELASASIARMGRDANENFSPDRFLTAWGKLTPAGKALLFRSGGKAGLAKTLDDIATVSTRFKELQQYANVSRTGGSVAMMATGSAIGTGAGALMMGNPVPLLTTLGTLVSGRVLAHLLARPASASAVRDFLVDAEKVMARRAPRAVADRSTKALALRIATDLNVPNLAPRITNELQGLLAPQAQQNQQ